VTRTVGNLTEREVREQLARATVTLQEIADCDEHGHTGMTWAQNQAWACLRDMRTLVENPIRKAVRQ